MVGILQRVSTLLCYSIIYNVPIYLYLDDVCFVTVAVIKIRSTYLHKTVILKLGAETHWCAVSIY